MHGGSQQGLQDGGQQGEGPHGPHGPQGLQDGG